MRHKVSVLTRGITLLFALVLSACAHRAPAPVAAAACPPVPVDANGAMIVRAVDYRQYLQELAPDELAAEYASVRAAHIADDAALEPRLRMISLLSLPHARFRNDEAALHLINTYIDMAPDDSLTNFLWLMADTIQEQKNAEQRRLQLQKRQEELQRQIDALKSLERNLRERDPPAAGAP